MSVFVDGTRTDVVSLAAAIEQFVDEVETEGEGPLDLALREIKQLKVEVRVGSDPSFVAGEKGRVFVSTTGALKYNDGSSLVDLTGGGGAADWTDLGDTPGTITADGIVVGNGGGTALTFIAQSTFAAAAHSHAAGDVTSGSFANGRISESSVTQHVAAIDHNSLDNLATGDVHTQYALLAGRSGAKQTLIGRTGDFGQLELKASDNIASSIIIDSTLSNPSTNWLKFNGGTMTVRTGVGDNIAMDASGFGDMFLLDYSSGFISFAGQVKISGTDSEMTVNDGNRAYDFRVKSDDATSMMFCDASANSGAGEIQFLSDLALGTTSLYDVSTSRLGLGTTSPTVDLHMVRDTGGASNNQITQEAYVSSSPTNACVYAARRARGTKSSPTDIGATDLLSLFQVSGYRGGAMRQAGEIRSVSESLSATGVRNAWKILPSLGTGVTVDALTARGSEVVINDGAADINFRVESDDATDILFVDAGADSGSGIIGVGGAPTDFNGRAMDMRGNLRILSQAIVNPTGTIRVLDVRGAAYTQLQSGLEMEIIDLEIGQTYEWETGALTTQRFMRVHQPTIAFVGSSTVTSAATVAIEGAPVAGTNATLTNTYALWVEAGKTLLAGDLAHTGTNLGMYSATPVAQHSSTGQTAGFTAGAGTSVLDDSTFTGGTGSTAYTIGDVVRALKLIGLMAA